MTDIPSLIEEVRKRIEEDGCGPEWAAGTSLDHRIIDALSLTVSPLPGEIAGYVTWLQGLAAKGGKGGGERGKGWDQQEVLRANGEPRSIRPL